MIYQAGNMEIDTANFHLSKNGKPIAVEPKVFDLIVYLMQNRERLVTRKELFDNVWKGCVVSDTSLSNHIKSARKALGDDGKKQQVIKTVHGRGYQFIAHTEELVENTTFPENPATAPGKEARKSIAVLPFVDLSPGQDQEYFSEGLSEELICLLGKYPELRVISRTSSFSFKDKNVSIQEIGSQLKVTYILEGSVRKAGQRLRITTQLIQVSDESNLWSETFDEVLDDDFRIQDDIARSVSKQLQITLLDSMHRPSGVDAQAYTLFLKAKYSFHKQTPEATVAAEQYVNESIAIDPTHARAWQLSSAITIRCMVGYESRSYEEGLQQAKHAAEKSLELDSGFALAYATLARVNGLSWEFAAAKTNISKALSLDACNSEVLNLAAVVSVSLGRIDNAIVYLKEAMKNDPLEGIYHYNLALNYAYIDRQDEAIGAMKKYAEFQPNAAIHHGLTAWFLRMQGKCLSALEEAEKEPHELTRLLVTSAVLFCLGRKNESDRLLKQIIVQQGDYHPSYIAGQYASRKQYDLAFHWLERAYQQRDPTLLEGIPFMLFRNLWNDPRWEIFLDRLQLPEGHWLSDQ